MGLETKGIGNGPNQVIASVDVDGRTLFLLAFLQQTVEVQCLTFVNTVDLLLRFPVK